MAQNNNQKPKDYVNNIFVKRVWSDNDGKQLFSIGVKRDLFIAELEKLEVKENGFTNLTMGTRKDDPEKFSVWVDDFKKGSNGNSAPSSSSSSSSNRKPSSPPASSSADETDDLPF